MSTNFCRYVGGVVGQPHRLRLPLASCPDRSNRLNWFNNSSGTCWTNRWLKSWVKSQIWYFVISTTFHSISRALIKWQWTHFKKFRILVWKSHPGAKLARIFNSNHTVYNYVHTYNHVQSCTVMYNHVQLCIIMYNHVQLCMYNYRTRIRKHLQTVLKRLSRGSEFEHSLA